MEQATWSITFLPQGTRASGSTRDTVLDAAIDAGVELAHDCGGNCACTTCLIEVDAEPGSLSAMEPVEDDRLATADNRTARSRLACQALLIAGPVTVTPIETW